MQVLGAGKAVSEEHASTCWPGWAVQNRRKLVSLAPDEGQRFGFFDGCPGHSVLKHCRASRIFRCVCVVREEGLEPSRLLRHRNLNPARLPIPPLALSGIEEPSAERANRTRFYEPSRGVLLFVMVLRGFEDRLERMVEGMFARAFKSGLQPVEVARKVVKEVDAKRTIDVRGRAIAPNQFDVSLSTADFATFADIQTSLVRELVGTVREHAQDEGLLFLGRVGATLVEKPSLRVGVFEVAATFNESTTAVAPVYLERSDGAQIPLSRNVATIGRLPESTVVLSDPNASRSHAELRPEGDSYVLVDLGSTNGSRINGIKVERQLLQDGDELTFGTITLTFRLP